MADKAKLTIGKEEIEFDILKGTLGPEAVDVSSLVKYDYLTYDPGFFSTAANFVECVINDCCNTYI